MILISGIHGVGKSYFTKKVREKCNIESYTASALIAKYKNCTFGLDKKVCDITDNQYILIEALKEMNEIKKEYLLDGHFCLLNNCGEIMRIELNTYFDMNPKAIVLLTEQIDIIAERRKNRDGIDVDCIATDTFQNEEKKYALEVAEKLCIPIFVSSGSIDIENAIDFIINITEEEAWQANFNGESLAVLI